ncbi:helix-hairpin-helix domain-containing protein [Pseudoxanthomonas mexicana]|uniref:helix-hairpin-helix domain-containing protein n=1 Tax=Pseudoxanthomonas mexicana TaxID=128785 RepID=UPI001FD657B8|nr:helix-hairpin-helix domain-containing protein [Pseudoxanthomonas mexicana]UOV02484.1 helix-hairpin-helix domain-containing protein [Pseudoxanthomonas mexicana]HMM23671.1 helix-hairpin-helix domain-containing protein [Pseudoxanthomonas mexicana]
MKARHAAEAATLEDIPNIGPSIAGDLRGIGIATPRALVRQDPYALYERVNAATGQRHDPCLCDCFIAAVRFMEGGPPTPWWRYTAERKRHFADHAG